MSHQLAMQSARDQARACARIELASALKRIITDMGNGGVMDAASMLLQLQLHLDSVIIIEGEWLDGSD